MYTVLVDSRTFYEQNCSSNDHLSSKLGWLLGLHGLNEQFLASFHSLYDSNKQFYLVTRSDGA